MDLHDNFGRPVSNIRIAVNSGCNLRCIYCHREGETKPDSPLPIDDIRAVLDIAHELGIKSVKFTGGEPLLRKDFIATLSPTVMI